MKSRRARLEELRLFLKQAACDAFIIPNRDQHFVENTSGERRLAHWLTGFSGSSAILIITEKFAGLWTDSRYFIQAKTELEGSEFSLIIPPQSTGYDFFDWLKDNLEGVHNLAVEGSSFSIKEIRTLKEKLSGIVENFLTDINLPPQLRDDNPASDPRKAFEHPLKYSGSPASEKLRRAREKMREKGITHHLLTSPDDIMWLLNIRGSDYKYFPVIRSFALLEEHRLILFAKGDSFPPELISVFQTLNLVLHPYDAVVTYLSTLPPGASMLVDPARTSAKLYYAIPDSIKIFEGISIPARLKATRNMTEITNLSEIMLSDGIVLTRFFFWFEMNKGKIPMTEHTLSVMISQLRSEADGFVCLSFDPIVAFNEHSALPHYSPSSGCATVIREDGILLVDTGSHYLGGTTDITRTIALGKPTEQQKTDFTLVLKGHISLARSKFPAGTKGYQLDILARQFLWEQGLNYGHGTGHGVGHCLNVHEGPHNISPAANNTAIEPGMVLSNEPAVYREGEYGIRTENLMVCYEDEETAFGTFLKFDTLSLCYIDKKLIDRNLLSNDELLWINSYHTMVYEKLGPLLNSEEKNWLWEKTCDL